MFYIQDSSLRNSIMSTIDQAINKALKENKNITTILENLESNMSYQATILSLPGGITQEELKALTEIQFCKKYVNANKVIPKDKRLSYGKNKEKLVLKCLMEWCDFMDSEIKKFYKNANKDNKVGTEMFRFRDTFKDCIIRYLVLKEIDEVAKNI